MAYRGSFPAFTAVGNPLPRYAGRLPCGYNSLRSNTPQWPTSKHDHAGRPAGLHNVKHWCLYEASSLHRIGGSARSHTSIPGFVNRPASGASAALITQPRIPILPRPSGVVSRMVHSGSPLPRATLRRFWWGKGQGKNLSWPICQKDFCGASLPTVPPQRTFAEIAVPALTQQVAYRPCVPAGRAGGRNRNGSIQLSLISAFSAL